MSPDHHAEPPSNPIRSHLTHVIEHLDHILPGQAPLRNFVHHNTLHGYQHLHFVAALAQAEAKTGIRAYLADARFRELYRSGRIDDDDLEMAAGSIDPAQEGDQLLAFGTTWVSRRAVHRLALIHDLQGISEAQLIWQIDECDALAHWQSDLSVDARMRLRGQGTGDLSEPDAVTALWSACVDALGLAPLADHDKGLVDAETIVAEFDEISRPILADACPVHPGAHLQVCAEAKAALDEDLATLGNKTLRRWLLELTGVDLLPLSRNQLIRFCASHLDEGLASWHSPDRGHGLYQSWRRVAESDLSLELAELPHWRTHIQSLPDDPMDAIIVNLQAMGIAQNRWGAYLESTALEIPGWSGIVNWRQHRPDYPANQNAPARLIDYLAVRLSLDCFHADRLCRSVWKIAGDQPALQRYFEANLSELYGRMALFAGELPEFLASPAQHLVNLGWSERSHHNEWRNVAESIWNWRRMPVKTAPYTHHGSAWRLFRLCQHLGITVSAIGELSRLQAETALQALDELSPDQRSYWWLCAYENHYRNQVLNALSQNYGRGRWRRRLDRPRAQIVFCMDDREESIRRHLEELNPQIETLGAAGFFGVPINWRGLDDSGVTPLCPVVVTPSHEVREQAQPKFAAVEANHRWGLGIQNTLAKLLHRELRRNLLSSTIGIVLWAPISLATLAGKVLLPYRQNRLIEALANRLAPTVPTQLELTAPADSPPATPEHPRLGFTDGEQADRVAGFLRTIGLTTGFAPLVVIAGHGSISQNNPHLAAYDCGACSGRHGGPNARAFATMANRPAVRQRLAERGILIPQDTWFLGSEHNTANEDLLWFDLDSLPPASKPAFEALTAVLDRALHLSAHERCRRLASAPRHPTIEEAMRHMRKRSADFSQARPELGHATNAAALIGRRSVTQGSFLDRRVFLISYDATGDADGKILENILLAAGPVGAGISLEYYFSTVNNESFGCGTKVPHNVAGFFGVMEGGSSDLRTGLPRQMIEIHEAMRLQVIVEASTEVLTAIYQRQLPLQELIGNGWILLSAIDPESGVISIFEPAKGFLPWQPGTTHLPEISCSTEWYQGHTDPLPPALIAQPKSPAVAHAG